MTGPARLFGDDPALGQDLNVVLIAAGGKEKRMPKAVRGLRQVFADEARRGVAAVAAGDRAMRRLQPTRILLAHHMAVGARRGIIGQIGPTLGIGKSIGADADADADQDSKQNTLNRSRAHE